ncbi:MAG: biotin transporter BioY [candidate division WOR-3 bacterium]
MYNIKESNDFRRAVCLVFNWTRSLTLVKKIVFTIGIACLTGLSAHVKVILPWTPVPITMQTFFVLLAGVLLGRTWGGMSQVIYVGLGMLGIQWFAGGSILGPTGGYLVGFILTAFFLGYVIDRYVNLRNFSSIFLLMFFANLFLVYIPGLVQLGVYFYAIKGSFPGLTVLLTMGFFPFIPGIFIKTTLAAAVAAGIMPKEV